MKVSLLERYSHPQLSLVLVKSCLFLSPLPSYVYRELCALNGWGWAGCYGPQHVTGVVWLLWGPKHVTGVGLVARELHMLKV